MTLSFPLPKPSVSIPAFTAAPVSRRVRRLAPHPSCSHQRRRLPLTPRQGAPPAALQPPLPRPRSPTAPINTLLAVRPIAFSRHNQSFRGLPLSDVAAASCCPITRMESKAGPPCQPIRSRKSRCC
ncbi:uncharacterized protein [Gorilla gorilla gorilla]|uniref:uncharacterized protein n=1 Tax=Gorilla gorilla gorilla TaxID=9595 RepID=UPI002445BA9E|nr:uncharacterized protein LOC129526037 [Gorilla gorilla gorilla]